jgi:hypothetical protein
MAYQKRVHFLVALFLVCTVFSNGVFAEACFCGQACQHGSQHTAKLEVNFPLHMRCSDTPCRSCVLEKGQIFRALNSVARTYHVKVLDTAIFFSLMDYPSTCHVFKDAESLYARGVFPSMPIYLQYLSILR